MDSPIRRPEDILASRPLRRVLAAKPQALWSVGPADNALTALRMMAEKNIGFVVVLERDALVGVLSERDCVRRIASSDQPLAATRVSEIMVRKVVTVEPTHTYADCLRLMHQHGIRHLPVMEGGKVTGVVSIRDLLGEAVAHYGRIITQLEHERLSIFTSTL